MHAPMPWMSCSAMIPVWTMGLVLSGDVESRFCRTCANYLSGPFLSRCQAHHEDVEPMHVCDDYVARPK